MKRRLPLLILTGSNVLLAFSIYASHSQSPVLLIWKSYFRYEALLGLFLFSGLVGLKWIFSPNLSERRLVLFFVASMLGYSAYTVLLFTYAVLTGSPAGIVLIFTLYSFIVYDFAEGHLG